MFEFTLRSCRVNKELSIAVGRYAKDMAEIAKRFFVGIGIDYDRNRDTLRIICRGKSVVAAAAVYFSLMSAAIILGARQDEEWKEPCRKAYSFLEEHPDEAAAVMDSIASLQLKLANAIRVRKAQERQKDRSFDMSSDSVF